jgi:hypothetical protein
MKVSLVALISACAMGSSSFALLDIPPPSVPPHLAMLDIPPFVPPHHPAMLDIPPFVPPHHS